METTKVWSITGMVQQEAGKSGWAERTADRCSVAESLQPHQVPSGITSIWLARRTHGTTWSWRMTDPRCGTTWTACSSSRRTRTVAAAQSLPGIPRSQSARPDRALPASTSTAWSTRSRSTPGFSRRLKSRIWLTTLVCRCGLFTSVQCITIRQTTKSTKRMC